MENDVYWQTGFVLDGTLFHHQINDMLRGYNASNEVITAHLNNLLKIIKPMKPVVFYLNTQNVRQRLKLARESRGQPVAEEEKILFWENRKRIDLHVIDRVEADSHIFDVDKGWDKTLESMKTVVRNSISGA